MRTTTTMPLCLAWMRGCASLETQGMTPKLQERLSGYLAAEHLPDSVAVISSLSMSFCSSS